MAVGIVKGDTVVLRRGKEKGKRGVVKAVYPKSNVAVVEGLNVVKRHTKQGVGGSRQAGIFEKESPIPISALTRVRRGQAAEGRVRISARSGETLLVPGKGR